MIFFAFVYVLKMCLPHLINLKIENLHFDVLYFPYHYDCNLLIFILLNRVLLLSINERRKEQTNTHIIKSIQQNKI